MKIQYGIIILAAGNSSRLGKPKQLLIYRDESLLKNTVRSAMALPFAFTLAISGAAADEVATELRDTGVSVFNNPDWSEGMASSIRAGIKQMKRLQPQIDACILSVCDQPYITTAVFAELTERRQQTGKGIVASRFRGIDGPPALFSSLYFDELEKLTGDEGARRLIKRHSGDATTISFEKGAVDIDTASDYLNLLNTKD